MDRREVPSESRCSCVFSGQYVFSRWCHCYRPAPGWHVPTTLLAWGRFPILRSRSTWSVRSVRYAFFMGDFCWYCQRTCPVSFRSYSIRHWQLCFCRPSGSQPESPLGCLSGLLRPTPLDAGFFWFQFLSWPAGCVLNGINFPIAQALILPHRFNASLTRERFTFKAVSIRAPIEAGGARGRNAGLFRGV